jgi:hypothetical protein
MSAEMGYAGSETTSTDFSRSARGSKVMSIKMPLLCMCEKRTSNQNKLLRNLHPLLSLWRGNWRGNWGCLWRRLVGSWMYRPLQSPKFWTERKCVNKPGKPRPQASSRWYRLIFRRTGPWTGGGDLLRDGEMDQILRVDFFEIILENYQSTW